MIVILPSSPIKTKNISFHAIKDGYNKLPMTKKPTKKKPGGNTIALNKKARHEFSVEQKFEAGLELQGWEVKSLRAGKVNISDTYVIIHRGEAYLIGATIHPLNAASSHVVADPTRSRKLLLNQRELDKLIGSTERQGYTIVALGMYWKRSWVKLEIGLAKGKKEHDKRSDIKEREWQRAKARVMKHNM